MSYRSLAAKPLNASLKTLLKRSGYIGVGLGAFAPVLALANPTGGQVIAGQATIANPSASGMVITQKSQSAIINWQQFNIGAGQYVQFLQPSSSSVVLNRVIGGSASSILGNLTGNGQVFLVNTNGVYFGKGSSIDTQGFLASTLGISDQNFLAHNYVFDEAGTPGATVVNQGNITAHHSGYVVLAGDYAENDGVIAAQSGHVILASGSKATLSLNGNSLINFAVNQSTLANYAGVKNTGSILADGGTVIMTADVANLLKSTVVNNTGLVEAQAISNTGGVIQLLATGGNIQNAGTLDASGTRAGQAGGAITLKGDERTTLTSTSNIDASGQGAKGGSLEISGKTINVRGLANLGKHGKMLLDPGTMSISTGNRNSPGMASNTSSKGHINLAFIEGKLNSNDSVTIQATHLIEASAGVKAITTTATGTGQLNFIAPTGKINLQGVDITIGGKLSASMHSGTFGHLTAGSINLHAVGSGGHIVLPSATITNGTVTTWSAKTTVGNLSITAPSMQLLDSAAPSATLALSAKEQLALTATYGNGSTERLGNLTLAAAKSTVLSSIHISGKLQDTASAGGAEVGKVIAEKGINISANNGLLSAQNLSSTSGSGITLTDTGNSLFARNIEAGSGNVSITDTDSFGGQTRIVSVAADKGSVTVNAGTKGQIQFGSPSVAAGSYTVKAAKGISLTAKGITFSGTGNATFKLETTTSDITVHGAIGSSGTPSLAIGKGGATLIASAGNVNLDHRVNVFGNVDIEAKGLNYTGTGSLEIDATAGGITLDASIGTAKAPVAYGVKLNDNSGRVQLARSIYTKSGISVTESHQTISGSAGVFVGNGDSTAITLSAKGPISLSGAQVIIGGDAPIAITADDGKASTSTDKLTITATGSVDIQPAFASASAGAHTHSGALVGNVKANVDHSVTLHAGADLSISGNVVHLLAGGAHAHVSNLGSSATAKTDVNISAGGQLKVKGNTVIIAAGFSSNSSIRASVHSASKKSVTATAEGDVSLTAGGDLIIAGSNTASIYGGVAYGFANAGVKGQKATAKSSATVSLNAGGNIELSGMTINVAGGKDTGTGSGASAHASTAVATVALHADVGLNAGGSVNMAGEFISLHGGNGVGGAFLHRSSSNSSVFQTEVKASAKGAAASVTVTSGLDITTGKAGMLLSASANLTVAGGDDAAGALSLDAANSGTQVTESIDASVNLASKGNVTLKAANLIVRGGDDAGREMTSIHDHGSSSATSSKKIAQVTAVAGGAASLTVDTGVTVNALGSIGIDGTSHATLRGGDNSFVDAKVQANNGASAKVTTEDGLQFKAKTAFVVSGANVTVQGGSTAARSAQVDATAGGAVASLVTEDSIGITAGSAKLTGGVITLAGGTGADASTRIVGGSSSVHMAHGPAAIAHAQGKATATLKETSSLNLALSGALSISGSSGVNVHGALSNGYGASAFAQGAHAVAGLTADGSVNIKAGSVAITSKNSSSIDFGGHSGGRNVDARAKQAGNATAIEKSAINITATKALTLNAGGVIKVIAGSNAGQDAGATATSSATAAMTGSDGINLQAGSVSLTAVGDISIIGGNRAADSEPGSPSGSFGGPAGAVATGKSKASFTENAAVGITATTTTLSATVTGGASGEHILVQGGSDAAMGLLVSATGPASAAATVNSGVTLTAKGGLTLSAPALQFGRGSIGNLADGASIKGIFGGKASLTATGNVNVSGASVALTGNSIGIFTQNRVAGSVDILGSSGGNAKLTAQANVGIKATGALTITANGSGSNGGLRMVGGTGIGGGLVKALGSSGDAALTAQSGISLSGKTVGITVTGLVVGAGFAGSGMDMSAASGGAVSVALATQVGINATGALTVSAVRGFIDAGAALQGSQIDADHGKVTVTDTSGTALTAGGNMSLNYNNGSLSLAAANVADHQLITAGPAGIISEKADTSLLLKSGAKLTLSNMNVLTADAGVFFAGSGATPTVDVTGNGKVSGLLNAGLSIIGKSITTSSVAAYHHNSAANVSDDGIVGKTGVTITGTHSPLSLGTVQQDALIMSLEPVLSAPQQTASTLFSPQVSGVSIGSADCQATLLRDASHCRAER